MLTLSDIRNDLEITQLINAANNVLKEMGYTDHGPRHTGYVCKTTQDILSALGYDERTVELGAIAGWIHDIGNAINRDNHGVTGAQMVYFLLTARKMDYEEVCRICSAIGNHEEQNGTVVSELSAALILADKSDAHRSRVRRGKYDPSDIHDRVNYAIQKSRLRVDAQERLILFEVTMDNTSSILEFLKIYLSRMNMCEHAAAYLGCRFSLMINGMPINQIPLPERTETGEPGNE
ncbi:MAG: HD domain-containing protein [Clostridia bacterium]|nr:HD domain-containing protein [Clostridia bacterium]